MKRKIATSIEIVKKQEAIELEYYLRDIYHNRYMWEFLDDYGLTAETAPTFEEFKEDEGKYWTSRYYEHRSKETIPDDINACGDKWKYGSVRGCQMKNQIQGLYGAMMS